MCYITVSNTYFVSYLIIQKYILTVVIIDRSQPDEVEKINEEAVVNSESKENEGGGWWDSLYSAAKSKVPYFSLAF